MKGSVNINTKDYWDSRFSSGDWSKMGGFNQTAAFARSQMRYFKISKQFDGVICDFGCGGGDAFPIYREKWPKAILIGVDISESAIEICRSRFGNIAEFLVGDQSVVPATDVIISSNTFEHMDNDKEIAKKLIEKCTDLYITVPHREHLDPNDIGEHVNSYYDDSFDFLGEVEKNVFRSRGWGPQGWGLLYHVYILNAVRPLLGKKLLHGPYQIMYHILRNI